MPVRLDTRWCDSCQRHTGQLQDRMDHTLHFLIAAVTFVWWFGWIITAMRRPYHPRHCMACGEPEKTPVPSDDQP